MPPFEAKKFEVAADNGSGHEDRLQRLVTAREESAYSSGLMKFEGLKDYDLTTPKAIYQTEDQEDTTTYTRAWLERPIRNPRAPVQIMVDAVELQHDIPTRIFLEDGTERIVLDEGEVTSPDFPYEDLGLGQKIDVLNAIDETLTLIGKAVRDEIIRQA